MPVVNDTLIIFRRYMLQTLRNPAWVVIGVTQPLMYLLLFAPLLKTYADAQGFPPGGAYNVFVPGLLVQLGLFAASGVGFGLISELRQGVIERMRVTPVSRLALLLGRGLRDMVVILVQSTILLVCSIPFGLSIGLAGALLLLVLVAVLGLLMSSVSYTLALALKSEDALAPVTFSATLPLLLLSGVLLPIGATAPGWLRGVADINPLKYAVDAARQAALPGGSAGTIALGFVIIGVLCVAAVIMAARAFGRAVA